MKAPSKPTTPPTALQLEQSMSLWMQLQQMPDEEGFRLDEEEIEQRIREAGLRQPHEMLAALIDVAFTLDQRADHADSLRRRYADKAARYREREERTRATVNRMMEILEVTACEAELGTASFAKPRKTVVITDFDALDERFIRRTDPEPRKLDIAAAIKAGETVAGAEMSDPGNSPPVLRLTKY
jgi:hypothetical protein